MRQMPVCGEKSEIMQTKTDFKLVPLKDIKPDPNQPRKYYDEAAMQELIDSVREKGILQPILLRPDGKGYLIVCGERRYKAAVAVQAAFKDKSTIPAVIRELSDEEALELQIIENLQRKDVHPMEEAVAFQSLSDKGKDIKEIAARVGKSEFYARQRIKLCSLTKEWQGVFFANRVSISDALKLALFDTKTQNEILEDEDGNDGRLIEISNWRINKYRGDLNEAPFPLDDVTLNKKAGACTNCQFNSATASLFADSHINPRCTNISCFANKSEVSFTLEFEKALNDPTILFVQSSYNREKNEKNCKKAETFGNVVYNHSEFNERQRPDNLMNYEEWKDYSDYEGIVEDTEEMKKEYQDYLDECKKELNEYETAIASGKFKKAFMLTGNNKGKYIYITLSRTRQKANEGSSSSKETKEKESAGTITAADIDEEIKRIKEREERAKEIDQNKLWDELKPHFNPSSNAKILGERPLSQTEMDCFMATVLQKIGYYRRDDFKHLFGKQDVKTVVGILKNPNILIRFFLLAELPPAIVQSGINKSPAAALSMQWARENLSTIVEGLELKYREIANKRNERVNKRIEDLRTKKKELTKKK